MFEVQEMDLLHEEISGRWMDGRREETGRIPMDRCDLMQFTGLWDMRGREIFEGDIVDDTHGRIGIGQATLVVRWVQEEARFALIDDRKRRIPWNCHLQEVIGNIHENRTLVLTR
ncbi:MAG: hypothetical protein JW821_14075 [Deltaproteobacteria bacterium]|nr:hypothetical protein [Deltaproteobacteria bacterium]